MTAGPQRAVLVAVEVVAHGALVDEQQRPRVVRVLGIGVVGEPGVQRLDDAGDAGRPRPHPVRACVERTRSAPRPRGTIDAVRFDTKIAIVLRDDLETWQQLNVTAFLASGMAANPELLGEPYTDADGTLYTPMFRQPVLVFEADKAVLTAAHERAVARGLPMAVFTAELFGTGPRRGKPGRGRRGAARRAGPRRDRGARAPQRRRQDDQGRAAAPLTPRRAVSKPPTRRVRMATHRRGTADSPWEGSGGLQGLHAELVAGGVLAQPVPARSTYSEVVSPGG